MNECDGVTEHRLVVRIDFLKAMVIIRDLEDRQTLDQ